MKILYQNINTHCHEEARVRLYSQQKTVNYALWVLGLFTHCMRIFQFVQRRSLSLRQFSQYSLNERLNTF